MRLRTGAGLPLSTIALDLISTFDTRLCAWTQHQRLEQTGNPVASVVLIGLFRSDVHSPRDWVGSNAAAREGRVNGRRAWRGPSEERTTAPYR